MDVEGLALLLKHKRMNEWLDDAGLTMKDVTRLFKALDTGHGNVLLSEFLDAISQMSTNDKDRTVLLHHESAKVLDILIHMKSQERGPAIPSIHGRS